MTNPFKKYFSKKPITKVGKLGKKEILLTECYTDKFGNKYFEPKDGAEYPFIRLLRITTYSKYAERNINSENLKKLMDLIMECAKKGDTNNIILYANDIKVAEDLFCEKNTLLNLASSLYLINDEKVDSWDDNYHQQKIKAMESDAEAMDFFLSSAYQKLQKSKEESPIQVVEYLAETIPIIEKITSLLDRSSTR
jgi:ribosomal protein S7